MMYAVSKQGEKWKKQYPQLQRHFKGINSLLDMHTKAAENPNLDLYKSVIYMEQ